MEGSVQLLIGQGSAQGGGDCDVSIEKNRTEKVGANQHLTVGGERQEKIGTKQILEAGQEIHLKAGMKIVIEAGMELTIKGAGGFVKIDAIGGDDRRNDGQDQLRRLRRIGELRPSRIRRRVRTRTR